MKLHQTVILVILIFMSLAAGVVKIMQMPQEVQFFAQAGVSVTLLIVLGVVQVVGGGMAIFQKTRRAGVALIGAGFFVSAIVIFTTGNIGFGAFSLLPAALAGFIFLRS